MRKSKKQIAEEAKKLEFSIKIKNILLEHGFSECNEFSLKKQIDDVDIFYELPTNHITAKTANNMITGSAVILIDDYENLEKLGIEPLAYVIGKLVEQVNATKQEFIKNLI